MLQLPRFPIALPSYVGLRTTVTVAAWVILQCALYALPVGGDLVDGTALRGSNKKLKYRLNGGTL